MRIAFRHVDAFTSAPFGGNPAAVCELDRWLDDDRLQAIAREFNLPATAFLVAGDEGVALRWFSPSAELELCGHATLASASVLLGRHPQRTRINFETQAGLLTSERDGARIAIDLPALPPQEEHMPVVVSAAIGATPNELWEAPGGRGMAVLDDASRVRGLRPDIVAIGALPFSALIVTAAGDPGDCDFVSRYFAPKHGMNEDFVTGSAHCVLAPYWTRVLGERELFARQLSARGGELWVLASGGRVRIAGECVELASGTLLSSISSS